MSTLRRRVAAHLGCHWWMARRMDRDLRACRAHVRGALLDVGCGSMPYRAIFEPLVSSYTGIDLPVGEARATRADAVGSALDLPFRDEAFDTVLCTQVIEHLPAPGRAMEEMARVLRPGGHLVMTSPLMQAVHEAPRDYYRITEYGLRHLGAAAGLQVVRITAQGGFWCMAGQNLNLWLWDRVHRAPYPLRNAVQLLGGAAMALFVAADRLLPDNRYTMNYLSVYRKPGSPP